MNENAYEAALKNVLMEIGNVCPDVRYSFVFTKEGGVVTEDHSDSGQLTEKALSSFQIVLEEAASVGGMGSLLVDGSNGKLLVSSTGGMYLGIVASKNVDMTYLRLIVHGIAPAIFKLLNKIVSAPLKTETKQKVEGRAGSQDLLVDSLEGFFGSDVQIDDEILERWSDLFEGGRIVEVEISTSEKKTLCKVKRVEAPELRGKGIIKMPKKIRKFLKVEKGDVVKVIPVSAFKGGYYLVNKQVIDSYEG